MGQDIHKGRRTEIDDINGLVVRRGAELGIAAPANAGIAEVVRRIERGELKPGVEAVSTI
jgi:2-dehydropantoate 2-reductase